MSTAVVLDIETGPLPWEKLESLWMPPEKPVWNEADVKVGNIKDAAKIKEKIEAARTAYVREVAGWQGQLEDSRQEFIGGAALSPVTGEILAIGLRSEKDTAILGESGETEAEILDAWWAFFDRNKSRRFVGYCSNFFDLPFVVWRSYFHGVAVPESAWDKTGRYPAYCFIDLIDRLPKRGFSDESRKLGDVCQWLGLGGKPTGADGEKQDGAMFAMLWRSGNDDSRQAALAYLANDLDMTWKLGERMGVI